MYLRNVDVSSNNFRLLNSFVSRVDASDCSCACFAVQHEQARLKRSVLFLERQTQTQLSLPLERRRMDSWELGSEAQHIWGLGVTIDFGCVVTD